MFQNHKKWPNESGTTWTKVVLASLIVDKRQTNCKNLQVGKTTSWSKKNFGHKKFNCQSSFLTITSLHWTFSFVKNFWLNKLIALSKKKRKKSIKTFLVLHYQHTCSNSVFKCIFLFNFEITQKDQYFKYYKMQRVALKLKKWCTWTLPRIFSTG